MLIEKPKNCPLCGGQWIRLNDNEVVLSYECENNKICQWSFWCIEDAFHLIKTLPKVKIWWSSQTSNTQTSVWWKSKHKGWGKELWMDIPFDPPFDISYDRLKLLLLFS